jgi:hypothetical protein
VKVFFLYARLPISPPPNIYFIGWEGWTRTTNVRAPYAIEVTFTLLLFLLRGQGSNLRPLGYEPNELPLLPPHNFNIPKFNVLLREKQVFFVASTGIEPMSRPYESPVRNQLYQLAICGPYQI